MKTRRSTFFSPIPYSSDFLLVAAGQIISIFGNQVLRYALPLYLLNMTGSSAMFGTVMGVAFIPMLILFPIGGIIADRFNKRNIMVMLDISTGALITIFIMLVGRMDTVVLMAAVMIILYGIQGAYQPAVQASIPQLVSPERLVQGNSIINTITSVSSMAAPIGGGILFSAFGINPILYISIACFWGSALMEIFIRIPFEKRKGAGSILGTGMADIRESFLFMFRTRPLIWKISAIYSSSGLFLTSLMLIAVPVIITGRLGFAPDTANRLYGYGQGVIAAGAIIGGVAAGIISKRLKPSSSPILIAAGAIAILIGGMAIHVFINPMTVYIILMTSSGLLVALSTILQIRIITLIQMLTPKELIGKVISCVICICMCTMPIGQLAYGFILEKTIESAYIPFYIASLIMLAIAILTRKTFSMPAER
jgi:MFS family permease